MGHVRESIAAALVDPELGVDLRDAGWRYELPRFEFSGYRASSAESGSVSQIGSSAAFHR